jgi:ferritin-like protein
VTPVEALQATLAAEHAAVNVYGVLGGRVSASEDPGTATLLRTCYDLHRDRRDLLRERLAVLGQTPVAAAPAYDVPARSRDARRLLEVAVTTEERCAEVYAQQVAGTSGEDRRWAVDALRDAAVRVLAVGGSPSTWPGLREL